MEKKRTVTKTKAADGSKSRVVTRNMKDGNTKVKSKTKSGGVVTKRKVTVGPKSTSTSTQRMGNPTTPSSDTSATGPAYAREKAKRLIVGGGANRSAMSVEKKTTSQAVKGKETVKNRKAKKGEVRKTKSKIDGNRISTTGTVTSSNSDPASPYSVRDGRGGSKTMYGQLRYGSSRSDIVETNKTRVTPAAKTTVKTKIKKRGRK